MQVEAHSALSPQSPYLQLIPFVGNQQRAPAADGRRFLFAATLGKHAPRLLPVQEEHVNAAAGVQKAKGRMGSVRRRAMRVNLKVPL